MFFSNDLLKVLKKNKINFFTGVPDSVLKNLSFSIENKKSHIVATNEGSAIGLAAGYYLSTKKLCCVYMQNSGLGNAINPLSSITHPKVYSIPMLLIIGWRGAPRTIDEPQHLVKGKITTKLLKLLKIKYCVLDKKKDFKKLIKLLQYSKKNKVPVACLIKQSVLQKKSNIKKKIQISKDKVSFFRHDVIRHLLTKIRDKTRIISTVGFTSRELNQIRKNYNIKKGKDFYMVGGMGHASILALGYSINSNQETICLDGDGSLLMHLGALGTIGKFGKKNFKHLLINNFVHESVGGQKTISENINFKSLVLSLGYKNYLFSKNYSSMKKNFEIFLKKNGPIFFEVQVPPGNLSNLGRPKNLLKIKNKFLA